MLICANEVKFSNVPYELALMLASANEAESANIVHGKSRSKLFLLSE